MTAHYKVHGDLAVITLDNPPVNGLGYSTRLGITQGLEQAMADSAVVAVIITGAGGAFSGGADIREFGSPKAMQEPNLGSVIRMIENATKPVVAAIHSVAMGGGLELALGCHYRIAAPGASIALPEVKLGLLPGAGGTQRLPRVLGVEPAVNMVVSGEAIKSEMLAMLPGQKLFDKMAKSADTLASLPPGPCRWCATCRAATPWATLSFNLCATVWARWSKTCLRRSSAWTRSRPLPRRSLMTAWPSSAIFSSA